MARTPYRYRPLDDSVPERLKIKDHAQHLLSADLLELPDLKELAAEYELQPSGTKKLDFADSLATAILDDSSIAQAVALRYCLSPKRWAAMLEGTVEEAEEAREISRFITHHGPENGSDWFGPLQTDENCFYIFTKSVRQTTIENEQPLVTFARWTCVADIREDHIVLHWNNMSFLDQREDHQPQSTSQFPYWRYIPNVKSGLEQRTGIALEFAPLQDTVLVTLWDLYEASNDCTWTHERIRANAQGVALTASGSSSGDDLDLDISGIIALTNALADSATSVVKLPERQSEVQHALLRTLIHGWNPRSYQFRLDFPDDRASFRAHVYFGAGPFAAAGGKVGQDSFPHMNCFKRQGGSYLAISFIRSYQD